LILASVVHIASGVDFLLVCVYGDPHHLQTKVIWDQISTFVHDNLGKPVVCLGDLNNIMSDVDTTSTKVNKSHMRSFNSYVKQCGLFDLGFSGPAYTWTNNVFPQRLCLKDWIADWLMLSGAVCSIIQMFSIFLLCSETMHLFLYLQNQNFESQDSVSNLRIGGLWKRIFKQLQNLLGYPRQIDLSMLEPLTLQELSNVGARKRNL
jgi:hypothetical protein